MQASRYLRGHGGCRPVSDMHMRVGEATWPIVRLFRMFSNVMCRMCQLLRRLCRNMRSKNFRSFLEPYEEAYPMKPEVPRGCYLGCPVSSSIQANFFVRQTEGLGRWVGKCFDPDNMIVANLIQAPVIGVVPAFKGALYVERSWMNETNNAWIIDYRGTPRQFGRDFTVYRDEFRFVDEGVILGHMYARPFTTTNPLPFGVNARVPFMLHQICDEELEKRALPSLA